MSGNEKAEQTGDNPNLDGGVQDEKFTWHDGDVEWIKQVGGDDARVDELKKRKLGKLSADQKRGLLAALRRKAGGKA